MKMSELERKKLYKKAFAMLKQAKQLLLSARAEHEKAASKKAA